MSDNFSIDGFEKRGMFAGLAFVPGSSSYVGQVGNQYYVGQLGLSGQRYFSDLASAKSAAQQLSGVLTPVVGTSTAPAQTEAPKTYAAFWEPLAGVGESSSNPVPPLPHPDASNLALGPNLGGADAVTFPGEKSPAAPSQPSGGGGGLLLLLGAGLLIFILARKK